MSDIKQPAYPDYFHEFDSSMGNSLMTTGQIVSPEKEIGEQVGDITHIGTVALAAEIIPGITAPEQGPVVPNPVTEKMRKKRIWINMLPESGEKVLSRGVSEQTVEADATLTELQSRLDELTRAGDPEATKSFLIKAAQGFRQHVQSSNILWANGNTELVLSGAEHSPFLRGVKEEMTTEGDSGWIKWLSTAPDEQIVNFSQWYMHKLQKITNPESREQVVQDLKNGYIGHVKTAMQDGWIDARHEPVLMKRIAKAQIRFFSPFGQMTRQAGGATDGKIVALPVTTGQEIVNHELGHIFAGIDPKSFGKYFSKMFGKQKNPEIAQAAGELFVLINEGFNEHMTAALLIGSPEIISPAERHAKGIPEVEGSSISYEQLREVFAFLVSGGTDAEQFTPHDMSTIIDSMVDEDFSAFAAIIDKRWGREGVIKELALLIRDEVRAPERRDKTGVIYDGDLIDKLKMRLGVVSGEKVTV
ncbi:MAG TPA: hypothetical protein PKA02_03925 [Candidatus Saccharibacteria bacterium]|nr:hypothetical protein [Candidatus Saccharibacteria bacterium]